MDAILLFRVSGLIDTMHWLDEKSCIPSRYIKKLEIPKHVPVMYSAKRSTVSGLRLTLARVKV